MGTIIEFLLECFAFGRGSKAEGRPVRNARGCVFAIVGVFAIVILAVAFAIWLILKP